MLLEDEGKDVSARKAENNSKFRIRLGLHKGYLLHDRIRSNSASRFVGLVDL